MYIESNELDQFLKLPIQNTYQMFGINCDLPETLLRKSKEELTELTENGINFTNIKKLFSIFQMPDPSKCLVRWANQTDLPQKTALQTFAEKGKKVEKKSDFINCLDNQIANFKQIVEMLHFCIIQNSMIVIKLAQIDLQDPFYKFCRKKVYFGT